jgi:hypothetical protein
VHETQTGLGQRMLFIECKHRHREQLLWPLDRNEESTRIW